MENGYTNPSNVTITVNNGAATHAIDVTNFADRQRPPAITEPDASALPRLRADKRGRRPLAQARDWFRIKNVADDAVDIEIYDEIADPIFTELFGIGISALSFSRELQEHRGKKINLYIDSPGGSVYQGIGIYNILRRHDAPVRVIVDGIAASIASVIAMAGDEVVMNPGTRMMIHRPWVLVAGDEDGLAKESEILHKIGEDIAGIYKTRGDSRINWMSRMKEETWFSAEEAVQVGLADRIGDTARSVQNNFDLSRFRNVPADLAAGSVPIEDADPAPTKRHAEQALRDAGFSLREAKAVVAKGWQALDEARDVPSDAPESDDGAAPGVTETGDTTGMVADPQSERQRVADFIARRDHEFALTG